MGMTMVQNFLQQMLSCDSELCSLITLRVPTRILCAAIQVPDNVWIHRNKEKRHDELEQSINDLRAEMGVEGSPSPLAPSKQNPEGRQQEEGSA